MTLLLKDEVCPRSNLSLALAGTTLDPLAELQSLKGLKPGAIIRLVEGIILGFSERILFSFCFMSNLYFCIIFLNNCNVSISCFWGDFFF